ncbi:hypothetical protein NEOLEDRAFT_1033362, partial [Neolentinus lepideus HHB14362 ss-1]
RLTEAQWEQYKKEGCCFVCGSKEHLANVHKKKGNTKKPFAKVRKAKDDEDLESEEEEFDSDKEEEVIVKKVRCDKRPHTNSDKTKHIQTLKEMFKQLTLDERVELFGELEDVETKALINSGCMGKIMSNKFAQKHKFPTHRLPKSIIARTADGTIMKGGLITHCVYAKMKIKGKAKLHCFVLANIKDNVILGYDWL